MKKYSVGRMMISCCPIASDPVSYLYLFEPVQTHASSSFPPSLVATPPGRWLTTCTADRRKPGRNLGHH
ncbi:hypothetical protein BH602_25140 [Pseudomonas aeruginosa]|nr:hypothetical protein BH602_25140 [Pseudomonas aeruginosa]